MTNRPGIFQHFAWVVLGLLVLAFSVVFLNVFFSKSFEEARVALAGGHWSGMLSHALWLFLPFVILALAVVWWKSREVSGEVLDLKAVFAAFRQGNMEQRPLVSAFGEFQELYSEIHAFAEELAASQASLHRERNELMAVFSAMTEGVVVLDRERRITRMNEAAMRLFSLGDGTVRERPLVEVIRHAGLQQWVESEEPERVQADLEFDVPARRVLSMHLSRIRNSVERVTGILLVFSDVTQLRRLEVMRQQFSSNVSHELKTPITSILGFIETLREETDMAPEERERYVDIIARQARRLDAIVEDLLQLGRLEFSEPSTAGMELQGIRPVVENALDTCRTTATAQRTELLLEMSGEPVVEVNAGLLEQALVNVIDNAVKYSPGGSHVWVEVEGNGDEVKIHVRDQGPGIPEKDLTRIFERFYRVDKGRSRQLGGTGLGLAIAKHIMALHHGRIDVESRLGEGSRFTLVLPAVRL